MSHKSHLSPICASLDEYGVLFGEEEIGEGVDGSDAGERDALVGRPGQVGPEHHRQVRRGHLVQAAPVNHLKEKKICISNFIFT